MKLFNKVIGTVAVIVFSAVVGDCHAAAKKPAAPKVEAKIPAKFTDVKTATELVEKFSAILGSREESLKTMLGYGSCFTEISAITALFADSLKSTEVQQFIVSIDAIDNKASNKHVTMFKKLTGATLKKLKAQIEEVEKITDDATAHSTALITVTKTLTGYKAPENADLDAIRLAMVEKAQEIETMKKIITGAVAARKGVDAKIAAAAVEKLKPLLLTINSSLDNAGKEMEKFVGTGNGDDDEEEEDQD